MTISAGIFLAGLIGLTVAYVELLARYRDDPLRAVVSWPAFAYGLINGGVGLLGAWWLSTFFPSAVASSDVRISPAPVDAIKLAVVAGFGSLAVLRTSLLKLRMSSGDDVSVGPAVIIDQLLAVVDRSVDRHLAEHRAEVASGLASQINFDRDRTALVSLCIVLLQNITPTEQQQMTSVSQALAGRTDISSATKAVSLVLALLGLVGESVLRQAVKQVAPKV
jgi:hypothetical protein